MSHFREGSSVRFLSFDNLQHVYFEDENYYVKDSKGVGFYLLDENVLKNVSNICSWSDAKEVRKKQVLNFLRSIFLDAGRLMDISLIESAKIILSGYSNNYISRLYLKNGESVVLKSIPHGRGVENIEFSVYQSILREKRHASGHFFKCFKEEDTGSEYLLLIEDMESLQASGFDKFDSLKHLFSAYDAILEFNKINSEGVLQRKVSLAYVYKLPDLNFLSQDFVSYHQLAEDFSNLFSSKSEALSSVITPVVSHNDFAFSNICVVDGSRKLMLFDFGKTSLAPLGADFGAALLEFYRYHPEVKIEHYIAMTEMWVSRNVTDSEYSSEVLKSVIETFFLAKYLRRLNECRVGERKVYKKLIGSNSYDLEKLFQRANKFLNNI